MSYAVVCGVVALVISFSAVWAACLILWGRKRREVELPEGWTPLSDDPTFWPENDDSGLNPHHRE